jgi:uncharacterized membrane protein YtjA (UPF0391 family)
VPIPQQASPLAWILQAFGLGNEATEKTMLSVAFIFFTVALIAAALISQGVEGIAFGVMKLVFVFFLAVFLAKALLGSLGQSRAQPVASSRDAPGDDSGAAGER